jgi:hypothetical protein
MTLLDDFRDFASQVTAEFGVAAVLTVPAGVASSSGVVTESPTDYAITAAGPVDESRRWQALATDIRVTATFYLPALGLAVVPAPGHRITYQGRRFIVAAVQPYVVQGGNVAFRLDCGEVGASG